MRYPVHAMNVVEENPKETVSSGSERGLFDPRLISFIVVDRASDILEKLGDCAGLPPPCHGCGGSSIRVHSCSNRERGRVNRGGAADCRPQNEEAVVAEDEHPISLVAVAYGWTIK
jgi:hypothetical protein